MPITRRTALQQLFIVTGGMIFLPACKPEPDQQETLEALADTLIPGDPRILGAKAAGAQVFALRMIHDCYPQDQQRQFMRGLEAFNQKARQQYGKSFARCDQSQQAALVSAVNTSSSQKTNKPDDLTFFFREYKNLVIQGYLGSQYFLTKIEVYELVPGRWHGCVPVKKS